MTPDGLVQLLLMIAGFLMAVGALIAILDRIESSLYDSVASRLGDVTDDLDAAAVNGTRRPRYSLAPEGAVE